MTDPVKSKIEVLEALVKELHDAAYSVLCESNGVLDNEWTTKDGVAIPEFPIGSFCRAVGDLDNAFSRADAYLKPTDAEKLTKWKDACATANFVVDVFKATRARGDMSDNLVLSSLHRNIADAIYGSLVQTEVERRAGAVPKTIDDALDALVVEGVLTDLKPNG